MNQQLMLAYLLGIVTGTTLTLLGLFALIEWAKKSR